MDRSELKLFPTFDEAKEIIENLKNKKWSFRQIGVMLQSSDTVKTANQASG